MSQPITQVTHMYLETLVLDYMLQGKMFTSLDIANQAKADGHQIRNCQVGNWLVENAIRIAKVNSHLYNQSLIRVDSRAVGMTLAYVYHHYIDDSDDYLDRDQNPKSFSVPQQSTPTPFLQPPQLFQAAGIHTRANVALPTMYFTSREKARDFARDHNEYKVQDNGTIRGAIGERWSCVER